MSPEGTLALTTTGIYEAGNYDSIGEYYRYRTGGTETFGFPDYGEGNIASSGARFVLTSSVAAVNPSDTNGIRYVYLIDREAKVTTLISTGPNGPGNDVSGPSFVNDAYLDLSRDGRFLAYVTRATNLGFADNNGSSFDVIIRDRLTGESDRSERDITPPNWARRPSRSARWALVRRASQTSVARM